MQMIKIMDSLLNFTTQKLIIKKSFKILLKHSLYHFWEGGLAWYDSWFGTSIGICWCK